MPKKDLDVIAEAALKEFRNFYKTLKKDNVDTVEVDVLFKNSKDEFKKLTMNFELGEHSEDEKRKLFIALGAVMSHLQFTNRIKRVDGILYKDVALTLDLRKFMKKKGVPDDKLSGEEPSKELLEMVSGFSVKEIVANSTPVLFVQGQSISGDAVTLRAEHVRQKVVEKDGKLGIGDAFESIEGKLLDSKRTGSDIGLLLDAFNFSYHESPKYPEFKNFKDADIPFKEIRDELKKKVNFLS